ncbi:MAG: metal ABC transporter solute-binding protein, Zn/Mn family [Alphaproteobacteria bacterium]
MPNIKKTLLILLLQFFLATPLWADNAKKLQVITSIYPLYDFAREVGGDKISVSFLLPPGVEAHSFDPSPKDMINIYNSDMLIYNSDGMETWVKKIKKQLLGKNANKKTIVIRASKNVSFIEGEDDHHHGKHHDEHSDHDDHDNHDKHDNHDEHKDHADSFDPHIWLSLNNAQKMVKNIANGLAKADRKNKKFYYAQAKKYNKKLKKLDKRYKKTIATCKNKTIIYGGHYAFSYLAKDYGLDYYAVGDFNNRAEPTAHDIKKIIDKVKTNRIKYIFHGTLQSPKIAKTLARETSAKLLLLNSAHNITKNDIKNHLSYYTIMQQNLKSLSVGLSCRKF